MKVFHLFQQMEQTFGSRSITKITDLHRVLTDQALAGHLAWVVSTESLRSPVMWPLVAPWAGWPAQMVQQCR